MSDLQHPYRDLEGTREWTLIDRALRELSANHDLEERTGHEHIVGYLCRALAEPVPNLQERLSALKRLQEMVQKSNLANRDLVQELIDERRREAADEEAGL